jgi:hypothetical protein
MTNSDVKGRAVSVNEEPGQLRRKFEFLRQRAIGGIWQTKNIQDDYVPLLSDMGALLLFTSATDKTFTVMNSLPEGWWCGVVQLGAGRANCVADTGATVNSRAASDRTLDQFSRIWLEIVSNSDGLSASCVISGDIG